MITRELLRAIRDDLPMKVTILRQGRQGRLGPVSKEIEGYFRFLCPACEELRATVNPRNNLAHCFCCGKNWDNTDVLLALGWDFLPAVDVLKQWLVQHCWTSQQWHPRDLGQDNDACTFHFSFFISAP